MSFIDSESVETCITSASFNDLEKALKAYGYNVERTKMQITATHGGYWSTNGHISIITITDEGDKRVARDVETAKGYMCQPAKGILAKIINYAESPEKLIKIEPETNPTSSQQAGIWVGVGIFCFIFIIAMIAIMASLC